jgi:MSHA pilin protein MshD
LIEVAVSTLIVGVVLSASMMAYGQAARFRYRSSLTETAALLAHDLVSEAIARPYKDPEGQGTGTGPEAGETGANRLLFDDVDDYNGWSESPPKARNGSTIPGVTNFTRSVVVSFVDPETLAPSGGVDQKLKMVVVTVSAGGMEPVIMAGFRGDIDELQP